MLFLIPSRMPTISRSWSDRSAPACLSPPHAPQRLLSSRLRALRKRCTPAESTPPTTTTPVLLLIVPWTSRTTWHASSGRLITTSWPSPWTPTMCTASKAQVQMQAASALWAQPSQRKTSATILCGTGDPNLRVLRSYIDGLRWALQTQMSCRATATPGAGALSSYTSSANASEITACRVCLCYLLSSSNDMLHGVNLFSCWTASKALRGRKVWRLDSRSALFIEFSQCELLVMYLFYLWQMFYRRNKATVYNFYAEMHFLSGYNRAKFLRLKWLKTNRLDFLESVQGNFLD